MSVTTTTVLLVMGMTDNATREQVIEAIEGLDGVEEVEVNLHRCRATVHHTSACNQRDLLDAIARAGFGATVAGMTVQEPLAPPGSR